MNYMQRFLCPVLLALVAALALAPAAIAQEDTPPPTPEPAPAAEEVATVSMDEKFDNALKPFADVFESVVFWGPMVKGQGLPVVLVLLAGTAIFLTIYFRFINLRGFGIALRTTTGKYSDENSPGEITHFQALTTALSATVGLGNIAGVAVAIGLGGPGATFWMIMLGLCGMTTKFAECTLGVKYRKIDSEGRVHGGAMYYLSQGLKERGKGGIGEVMSVLAPILSVMFAIFVIGGAFGAGNMFQANQAYTQFSESMAPAVQGWQFGTVMAILVGLVIIGGIVSIARVTSILVPFMCVAYLIAAVFIIFANIDQVGSAFSQIVAGAFNGTAVAGGIVGVLIQGIKRAAFSNEAGLGSAPIAHSAVKTDKPASEGFVALLEPFTDTVVVCTMTAMVIIISGSWQVSYEVKEGGAPMYSAVDSSDVVDTLGGGQYVHTRDSGNDRVEVISLVSSEDYSSTKVEGWVDSSNVEGRLGVPLTSLAFASVISWFPKLLTIAVFLFAFSTMISWSYYGQQGVYYLFKGLGQAGADRAILVYRIVFCMLIVVGSSAGLNNVIRLSDAMVFAMVIPNLIGLYFLLPVVREETDAYLSHVRSVDGKS